MLIDYGLFLAFKVHIFFRTEICHSFLPSLLFYLSLSHTHTHTHPFGSPKVTQFHVTNVYIYIYLFIYKIQDFHFSIIVEQLEILKFDNVCDFRFMFLFCFKSHMFFTMDKDLWFRRENMKEKKKLL